MKLPIPEERQILEKALSGSRKALELLVRRYSDLVYKSVQYTLLARNVSFTKDDLEDFHNTVFLRLFENRCKKLRQYKGKNGCSIASWIRMISVRIVLDHLRIKNIDALASRKMQISIETLPELKMNGKSALFRLEKDEQRKMLTAAMEQMPARERMFLKLHIYNGLSMAEAAETMQIPVNTAYILKHRAIQRLKSYVESLHQMEA